MKFSEWQFRHISLKEVSNSLDSQALHLCVLLIDSLVCSGKLFLKQI